jgi:hypothetical protein
MLSADTKLTERGDQTGINYRQRHAAYAQRLRDGIRNNKAWAVDLLKYWDSILFPNNDDSADASGAPGGEDDEMDLVDEAFDGAPSVVRDFLVYLILVDGYEGRRSRTN